MKKLLACYFSGTNNTRYVVRKLCKSLEKTYSVEIIEISKFLNVKDKLNKADILLIGFPIYGSMPPSIVVDFVIRHKLEIKDKDVIIIETQFMYSIEIGRAHV